MFCVSILLSYRPFWNLINAVNHWLIFLFIGLVILLYVKHSFWSHCHQRLRTDALFIDYPLCMDIPNSKNGLAHGWVIISKIEQLEVELQLQLNYFTVSFLSNVKRNLWICSMYGCLFCPTELLKLPLVLFLFNHQ